MLNEWNQAFIDSLNMKQKAELQMILLEIITKFTDFGQFVENQKESQRAIGQYNHAKNLLRDLIDATKK